MKFIKLPKFAPLIIGMLLILGVNAWVLDGFFQSTIYRLFSESGHFLSANFIRGTSWGRAFLRAGDTATDLNLAREERDMLRGATSEAEVLKRENESLRKQLGVEPRADYSLKIAKIFSIQRTALASVLHIDLGISDGVTEGMVVVAGGNVLIGSIIDVQRDSSTVLLIDDPRSIISVRLMNGDILAESKGGLKGSLRLNLISHADVVEIGSTVVTSGLDAYPEGLVVGNVEGVMKQELSLFQDVYASMMFNPASGPRVFVMQ